MYCLSYPVTRVTQIYPGLNVEPIWVIPITFMLTSNIIAYNNGKDTNRKRHISRRVHFVSIVGK